MQCKDIADIPVLRFLRDKPWGDSRPATWFLCATEDQPGYKANGVLAVMPAGTPEKLALAKMRRGVVDGCPCGCRGDFKITQKGLDELQRCDERAAA